MLKNEGGVRHDQQVDHVSGREPEGRIGKMWTRFEVNRHVTSARRWHTLRGDCRMQDKGKGKCGDGRKGCAKGRGQTMKGAGKKGSGKPGNPQRVPLGESTRWGYQGQFQTCGRIGHMSAESRWCVGGVEEDEEEEDVGGFWVVGRWSYLRRRRRPAIFLHISPPFEAIREEQGYGLSKVRGGRRDGFSDIREDRRNGFSHIGEDNATVAVKFVETSATG